MIKVFFIICPYPVYCEEVFVIFKFNIFYLILNIVFVTNIKVKCFVIIIYVAIFEYFILKRYIYICIKTGISLYSIYHVKHAWSVVSLTHVVYNLI